MPGPTAVPVTLADVRERISTDESLTRGRRLALRCSLKRVGDLLGMDLVDLPADLVTLRKRLASIHHVQAGIKRKRLWTFRADLTFAIKQCGIPVVRTA